MKNASRKNKIDKIGETDDNLTSRGGLFFFDKYLNNIGIFSILAEYFGDLRKSKKGQSVTELFRQIFCFFCDKTSRHLTHSDALAEDAGYAAMIGQEPENMASSHTVKRFFKSFSIFKVWIFRKILQKLFIWRLKIGKPDVIRIDMDTMVMDNNDADVRHGVSPTYKKKKGFQPLQVTWGRFVIDAVFRGGSCHSNHEDTVIKTVTHLANLIRSGYRQDAIIVLTCDGGFFDQKNFKAFEKHGIFYIAAARITEDVRNSVSSLSEENFLRIKKDEQVWQAADFGFTYGTWDIFRRFIFCQPIYKNEQMLLTFERADTLLATNIRSDTVTEDMPEDIRDGRCGNCQSVPYAGRLRTCFPGFERLRYGADAF
jgi:hypothetical protein